MNADKLVMGLALITTGCLADGSFEDGAPPPPAQGQPALGKADQGATSDTERARQVAMQALSIGYPNPEPRNVQVSELPFAPSLFEVSFDWLGRSRYYVPLDARSNDHIEEIANLIYREQADLLPGESFELKIDGVPGVSVWRFDITVRRGDRWLQGPELFLAVPAPAVPERDAIAESTLYVATEMGAWCTGTLIAPRLVLTAAHCDRDGAQARLYAGSGSEIVASGRFEPHREYRYAPNHSETLNDIAFITLEREVDPESGLTPMALDLDHTPRIGEVVTVAGYGKPNRGFLRAYRAEITQVGDNPRRPAVEVLPSLGGGCTGVSGGPVVSLTDEGEPHLVGVLSGNSQYKCGFGYGTFTGLEPYRDEVEERLVR